MSTRNITTDPGIDTLTMHHWWYAVDCPGIMVAGPCIAGKECFKYLLHPEDADRLCELLDQCRNIGEAEGVSTLQYEFKKLMGIFVSP